MPTLNLAVSAVGDNGWEEASTTWFGDDIWFGQYAGPTLERGAFRFLNVTVPQGTTITSATLTMQARSSFGTVTQLSLNWRAQAIDNASAPASGNRPSGWTVTTAGATFTVPNWTPGTDYSWSITSVIQEIVNRAGWASGNALNITANGSHSGTPELQADSFGFDPAGAPRLQIVWPDATPDIVYRRRGGYQLYQG